MTETILFSLLFARFKGFKWSQIFKLFKHWSFYPIIATCLIHIYIVYLMIQGEYWFVEYSKPIKIASILFYLFLIRKYKLFDISVFNRFKVDKNPILTTVMSPVTIGVISIAIGSILNSIAMIFNGGKMPVFPSVSLETGYTKMDMFDKMLQYNDWHVFGNIDTNLIFLTDVFDGFFSIMSLGDLFVRLFVVLIIYYSIKQCNKE